jgi:hypothetical protein
MSNLLKDNVANAFTLYTEDTIPQANEVYR